MGFAPKFPLAASPAGFLLLVVGGVHCQKEASQPFGLVHRSFSQEVTAPKNRFTTCPLVHSVVIGTNLLLACWGPALIPGFPYHFCSVVAWSIIFLLKIHTVFSERQRAPSFVESADIFLFDRGWCHSATRSVKYQF